MVEQQLKPALQFAGTKRERDLAEKVMSLILARGMFMSANAPIRIRLGSLAEFLDSQGEKDSRARIDALVTANPDIFVVEDGEGEQFLVTTRDGRAPQVYTSRGQAHIRLPLSHAAAKTRRRSAAAAATPGARTS